MNKKDFIKVMAKEEGLSMKDASRAYDCVFRTLSRQLANQEEIKVRNFGTFCIRTHRPKMFQDFQTGQKQELPAYARPVFIPSDTLKEEVEKGRAQE